MKTKHILGAGLITLSFLGSSPTWAELSANVGLTSNYVWRGLTQTDDGAAIQGGLDYAHETGVYAGTWASNVDEGFEIDLYVGYAGEIEDFGYDLGYLTYNYTDDAFSENFGEFYLGGSYKMFSLTYAMGDYDGSDYTYLDLGAEFEIQDIATLALHYGKTDADSTGGDYDDYSISISKDIEGFDLSLAYSSEDLNDEDEVFITVGKSFDL